jgi:holliday junction DNA helicase RuvA
LRYVEKVLMSALSLLAIAACIHAASALETTLDDELLLDVVCANVGERRSVLVRSATAEEIRRFIGEKEVAVFSSKPSQLSLAQLMYSVCSHPLFTAQSICYPPVMIAHLRGTVHRCNLGEVTVDVSGVGYRVQVPLEVFEKLHDGVSTMLWISTYVREDRFDLFGFLDRTGQLLFEELLKISGIGPKTALELCNVPRAFLLKAVQEQDPRILSNIKGIGKKTAEKLVIELRSLLEKHPLILGSSEAIQELSGAFDQDAIAALSQLGYDSPAIMHILRSLPSELRSTEERVAAALRSL